MTNANDPTQPTRLPDTSGGRGTQLTKFTSNSTTTITVSHEMQSAEHAGRSQSNGRETGVQGKLYRCRLSSSLRRCGAHVGVLALHSELCRCTEQHSDPRQWLWDLLVVLRAGQAAVSGNELDLLHTAAVAEAVAVAAVAAVVAAVTVAADSSIQQLRSSRSCMVRGVAVQRGHANALTIAKVKDSVGPTQCVQGAVFLRLARTLRAPSCTITEPMKSKYPLSAGQTSPMSLCHWF
jgi:hypothetical protein